MEVSIKESCPPPLKCNRFQLAGMRSGDSNACLVGLGGGKDVTKLHCYGQIQLPPKKGFHFLWNVCQVSPFLIVPKFIRILFYFIANFEYQLAR